MLTITPAASDKLAEIMRARHQEGSPLRLSIKGRSNIEFKYDLRFVEADAQDAADSTIDCGDFTLLVSPEDMTRLDGTVIDFVNVDGGGLRIENPNPVWVEPTARAVGELIEGRINPGILSHGGYVEMVDYREGVVYITMLGGCQGCAMSAMTLKMGIEQAIRQAVPEIREVVDMTNHTQGTNPFYR